MSKLNGTIGLEIVHQYLDYDTDTGIFIWKYPRKGIRVGDRAGRVNTNGYRDIQLFGNRYLEHRLAWFYHYGEWPEFEVDHINRIRDDNRIKNLQEATSSTNMHNMKISKGCYFHKPWGRWVSAIKLRGKRIQLGDFETEEEAIVAYLEGKLLYHVVTETQKREILERLEKYRK